MQNHNVPRLTAKKTRGLHAGKIGRFRDSNSTKDLRGFGGPAEPPFRPLVVMLEVIRYGVNKLDAINSWLNGDGV